MSEATVSRAPFQSQQANESAVSDQESPLRHHQYVRPAAAAGRPRSHLTVADVCDELGISKSTFYDWRAAHKAPCCIRLPNGSLRVRRADLERWLSECEEPA
ncbi:helix-turn-helix transcriptional regulator [Nocardioides iriomotensis]|uniref:DNA-binding protein n=1 Tax=Nocardioides iriomotensis TaxID=715784 RepID=A0A4Q5J9Z9_9ACTN|nr:helix-turn-helix domain-containing protein [Nocardioides iriomotensis]RYU14848.1 DNA-binding protein [Nocardioides iriomotensis]